MTEPTNPASVLTQTVSSPSSAPASPDPQVLSSQVADLTQVLGDATSEKSSIGGDLTASAESRIEGITQGYTGGREGDLAALQRRATTAKQLAAAFASLKG